MCYNLLKFASITVPTITSWFSETPNSHLGTHPGTFRGLPGPGVSRNLEILASVFRSIPHIQLQKQVCITYLTLHTACWKNPSGRETTFFLEKPKKTTHPTFPMDSDWTAALDRSGPSKLMWHILLENVPSHLEGSDLYFAPSSSGEAFENEGIELVSIGGFGIVFICLSIYLSHFFVYTVYGCFQNRGTPKWMVY